MVMCSGANTSAYCILYTISDDIPFLSLYAQSDQYPELRGLECQLSRLETALKVNDLTLCWPVIVHIN